MAKTKINIDNTPTKKALTTEEVKDRCLFGFFLHEESGVLYFRHRKHPNDFLNVGNSDDSGGFRHTPSNAWFHLPEMGLSFEVPSK